LGVILKYIIPTGKIMSENVGTLLSFDMHVISLSKTSFMEAVLHV